MENINLDKINEMVAENNFESAKENLTEFLKNDPENLEAIKLLGLCNVNLGLFSEGLKNFNFAIKQNQSDATSWFYLANCYDNIDNFTEATNSYLKVIELRENYFEAYQNLIVLYLRMKEPQLAKDLCEKVLLKEEAQQMYMFYYLASTASLALKDFTGCFDYAKHALSLNANHDRIYANLATAHLALGHY